MEFLSDKVHIVSRARQVIVFGRLHWLMSSLVSGAILAFGIYVEPFSPRYEGLTARQWIAHNAKHQLLPRREVVRHFGPSVMPMLLRESEPSGFFSASIAFENATGKRWFDALRSADFDRRLACGDWAQMLRRVDPGVFERLLASTRNDQLALAITRLFHGERYLSTTLQTLSKQSTNANLQARAEHLLQVYRSTI